MRLSKNSTRFREEQCEIPLPFHTEGPKEGYFQTKNKPERLYFKKMSLRQYSLFFYSYAKKSHLADKLLNIKLIKILCINIILFLFSVLAAAWIWIICSTSKMFLITYKLYLSSHQFAELAAGEIKLCLSQIISSIIYYYLSKCYIFFINTE